MNSLDWAHGRWCCVSRFIIVVILTLLPCIYPKQVYCQYAGIDEFQFVPNGDFDATIAGVNAPYTWDVSNFYMAYYWRQFSTKYVYDDKHPDRPIWTAYRYNVISRSTPDLYTTEVRACDNGIGSPLWIPENRSGIEALTDNDAHGNYAVLYNRLNSIDRTNNDPNLPATYVMPEDFGWAPNTSTWREYIQTELLNELQAGDTYHVSYDISLADESNRRFDIQVYLSNVPFQENALDVGTNISDLEGVYTKVRIPERIAPPGIVTVGNDNVLPANTPPMNGWYHHSFDYTAVGGERYIAIGNFQNNLAVPVAQNEGDPDCRISFYYNGQSGVHSKARADYYIDNVSVTAVTDCSCEGAVNLRAVVPTGVNSNGDCCFDVYITNGWRGNYINEGPLGEFSGACSIYYVQGFLSSSLAPGATPINCFDHSTGANGIPGDGLERYLGQMCVPNLTPNKATTLTFRIYSKTQNPSAGGEPMCSRDITLFGCDDQGGCNCDEFRESVVAHAAVYGENDCCVQFSINPSLLGSLAGCNLTEVRYYRGEIFNPVTEIASSRYILPSNSTVGTHLLLNTFCLPGPIDEDELTYIWVEFRSGTDIICMTRVPFACRCRCKDGASNDPDLEKEPGAFSTVASIIFTETDAFPGQCCFEVSVVADGTCSFDVSSVNLYLAGAQLVFTPSSGWAVSPGQSGSVTITASTQQTLMPNSLVTIGTVCLPECSQSSSGQIQAILDVDGSSGICRNILADNNSDLYCDPPFDCDQIYLDAIPSSYFTSLGCCYTIYAGIKVCSPHVLEGYYLEITGPNGYASNCPIPLATSDGVGSEVTTVCATTFIGATYTVKVKSFVGEILCTKTIQLPACSGQ